MDTYVYGCGFMLCFAVCSYIFIKFHISEQFRLDMC